LVPMGSPSVIAQRASIVYDTAVDESDIRLASWQLGCAPYFATILPNDHSVLPETKVETALQNAFKAIEAVIGDPPKDDRKLALKLRNIGLDFQEEVGYGNKDKLGQLIRKINLERDRKAAHGSTSPRTIRIVDMMEYQACARYIVIAALEHEASQSQSP